jgi:hypothetical protein
MMVYLQYPYHESEKGRREKHEGEGCIKRLVESIPFQKLTLKPLPGCHWVTWATVA